MVWIGAGAGRRILLFYFVLRVIIMGDYYRHGNFTRWFGNTSKLGDSGARLWPNFGLDVLVRTAQKFDVQNLRSKIWGPKYEVKFEVQNWRSNLKSKIWDQICGQIRGPKFEVENLRSKTCGFMAAMDQSVTGEKKTADRDWTSTGPELAKNASSRATLVLSLHVFNFGG